MKIYILIVGWYYEGSEVKGYTKSENVAKEWVKEKQKEINASMSFYDFAKYESPEEIK